MQRVLARAAAAVTWLTLACPIGGAQEPQRPQLPRGADVRHWEPYFDHGVQRFKRSPIAAEEAFYWASRLDPTRAEPLFGRYAAFFAHTRDRDVTGYFRDDAEVWSRPEVRAAVVEDASFAYAHAGLATIARLQREPGRAVDALGLAVELAPGDPVLRQERGELLLTLQRLPEAAADFTRAAELEPFWPAPVLGLARVREREGQGDAATTLYRRFVGMAPADDAQAAALRQRGIVP